MSKRKSPSDARRAQRRLREQLGHHMGCALASREAKAHAPLHPARAECHKRAHPLWLQVR